MYTDIALLIIVVSLICLSSKYLKIKQFINYFTVLFQNDRGSKEEKGTIQENFNLGRKEKSEVGNHHPPRQPPLTSISFILLARVWSLHPCGTVTSNRHAC